MSMRIKSDAKEVINRLAKHIISEIKKAKGVEFDTFLFFRRLDRRDSNSRHKLLGLICGHRTLYPLSYGPI